MEAPGHEKRMYFRLGGQGSWELLSSHSTTRRCPCLTEAIGSWRARPSLIAPCCSGGESFSGEACHND